MTTTTSAPDAFVAVAFLLAMVWSLPGVSGNDQSLDATPRSPSRSPLDVMRS